MSTDFKGYLLSEFVEDYEQGLLTRRQALKLLAGVTGSLALANVLLVGCTPEAPPAPTMTLNFPSPAAAASATPTASQPTASAAGTYEPLAAGDIEFPGDGATLLGHLARPSGAERRPAVLVCHENRGLTEHIKDVARRLASAGYVGLAVDLLSRIGGTSAVSDPADVPGILGNTPPEQFLSDFVSAWRWLQDQAYVLSDGVGMVGFCFGGGVTWRVAIGLADVRAAVPFYGPHPDPAEVGTIQGAVLAIYAGNDERINQSIPAIEAAMQAAGKVYEKVIYPGVDNAFHNDTGSRYNPEAATDAWARTLDWFRKYLATV
jgi:carboxymethylenebutenolidase